MIDLLQAMDSVVAAAEGRTDGGSAAPLAETAIALALPAARRSGVAAAVLADLRHDGLAAARTWDCSLGAVVVWRGVDRAERAGLDPCAAAEAGLRQALAYVELLPERLLTRLGADEVLRTGERLLAAVHWSGSAPPRPEVAR